MRVLALLPLILIACSTVAFAAEGARFASASESASASASGNASRKAAGKKMSKSSAKRKKKKAVTAVAAPVPVVAVNASPVAYLAPVLDPAVAIAPSYSTEDEKLQAVLAFVFNNDARKYGWPSNYTAMWCPTNAFHLVKRLEQAGVDLAGAEVWYIIPSDSAVGSGESVVYPRQPRPIGESSVSEWAFHVVISIKGRILDLDFTSQPHVLLQVQYAAQMWQKGPLARPQEDRRPLFVRRIPAADYLQQYTDNWFYYVSGGNGRYPAVEMSSLFPSVSGGVSSAAADADVPPSMGSNRRAAQ